METRYVTAPDGVRIAYDVTGAGPCLLLLHGHTEARGEWHVAGYIERLRAEFTVVPVDVRGQGESDAPDDPAYYAVDRVLADTLAVADACGFQRFGVWGYSFGGAVALRLAARTERLTRMVIAGCPFGHTYPPDLVERSVAQARTVLTAKERGELDTLPLTPAQRAIAERLNIPAHIACLRALVSWPAVAPHELRCPALVYAGMDDEAVTPQLETQRRDIETAGITLHLFPGLDHGGEFVDMETVLPAVMPFLRAKSPSRM